MTYYRISESVNGNKDYGGDKAEDEEGDTVLRWGGRSDFQQAQQ